MFLIHPRPEQIGIPFPHALQMETKGHTKEAGQRAKDSMPTLTTALFPPHPTIPQLGPDVKPASWALDESRKQIPYAPLKRPLVIQKKTLESV